MMNAQPKLLPYASKVYPWWRKYLTLAEYAVLIALVAMRDKLGFAYPSIKGLAKHTCLSGRHVSRAVRTLIGLGWIERMTLDGRPQFFVNPPEVPPPTAVEYDTDGSIGMTPVSSEGGQPCQPAIPYRTILINNTNEQGEVNFVHAGSTKEPLMKYQNPRRLPATQDDETPSSTQDAKLKKRFGQAYALSEHLAQHLRRPAKVLCFPAAMAAWDRLLALYGSYDAVRDIIDEAMKPANKAQILLKVKNINPCSIEVWASQNIAAHSEKSEDEQRAYNMAKEIEKKCRAQI